MGVYMNPGNDAFQISVNDDIYIDKSGIISFMNGRIGKRKRFICVSRPRRFGKSMAAEMLSAYYDRSCDSSELFQNLEIAEDKSFDIHLNAYDVFFLNIQQFLSGAGTADKLVEYLQAKVLEEVREIYGQYISDGENRLSSALATIYSKDKRPNKGFIFIVDEWDCVFREAMILPIKKYGTHSALNIFDEFSMIAPGKLAKYVGFTETEVRKLCRDHKLKFSEAKRWYDGYRFKKVRHVYNPKSIVDAITEEEFRSYWTSTETYEALQIYIDMDINGLREAIVSMLGNNSKNFAAKGEFGWDGAAGAYVMIDPDNHIGIFYATHVRSHGEYLYNELHPAIRDEVYRQIRK